MSIKSIALTIAVAAASSALTALAVGRAAAPASPITDREVAAPSDPAFVRAAHTPPVNTDFTSAAERTVEGVVSIKSYATQRRQSRQQAEIFSDPFFEFFFGPQQRPNRQQQQQSAPREQPLGLGSGVIISSDGYIATNNHVIDGADRLEVTLNDNRTYDAIVIGSDADTDLALIKIEADSLAVIPLGDSDALRVGEWVLAVGNPFGFTSTVTTGIVSAKARSISSSQGARRMGIESYIQTDAAVNPGNSGGALVNIDGELVGINTAIYSQTGNYAGYSFAIPVSIVAKVMNDMKEFGTVQRAVLGVQFMELTPALAKEKNIEGINDGIYVAEVVERGSAADAGIKAGDVIVSIDGAPTHSGAQLQELLARHRPGDSVAVGYLRDGKRLSADVTLRNSRGNTSVTKAENVSSLGAAFRPCPEELLRKLGLRSGLQVSGLADGKFRDAGIPEGFVVVEINNSRVSRPSDVEAIYNAIMKADEYDKVMFITGYTPSDQKKYFAVDLAE
ncbi:MAG: Do family serine endopeptidase [Pseudoflavonifractor sp.]|nr:Do family serine endopeptidase [Alloprevotella sp.]MCM1116102.1 Do family serine endopeptidase [Pseudoflavonifractor sp.]